MRIYKYQLNDHILQDIILPIGSKILNGVHLQHNKPVIYAIVNDEAQNTEVHYIRSYETE